MSLQLTAMKSLMTAMVNSVYYTVCGLRRTIKAQFSVSVVRRRDVISWITPWYMLISEVIMHLDKRWGIPDLKKIKKVFPILIRVNPVTRQEEIFMTVDTRYDVKGGHRIDRPHEQYEMSFTGGGIEKILLKRKNGVVLTTETVREAAIAEIAEETGVDIEMARDIRHKGPVVQINNKSVVMLLVVTDDYGMRLEKASGIVPRVPIMYRNGNPVLVDRAGKVVKTGGTPLMSVPEQHARAWRPVSDLLEQSRTNSFQPILEGEPPVRLRKPMLDFLTYVDNNIEPDGLGDHRELIRVAKTITNHMAEMRVHVEVDANRLQRLYDLACPKEPRNDADVERGEKRMQALADAACGTDSLADRFSIVSIKHDMDSLANRVRTTHIR